MQVDHCGDNCMTFLEVDDDDDDDDDFRLMFWTPFLFVEMEVW